MRHPVFFAPALGDEPDGLHTVAVPRRLGGNAACRAHVTDWLASPACGRRSHGAAFRRAVASTFLDAVPSSSPPGGSASSSRRPEFLAEKGSVLAHHGSGPQYSQKPRSSFYNKVAALSTAHARAEACSTEHQARAVHPLLAHQRQLRSSFESPTTGNKRHITAGDAESGHADGAVRLSHPKQALNARQLVAICAGCGAATLGTAAWLVGTQEEEPVEEDVERVEPPLGTVTSIAQIWGMTGVNIAYGFMTANLGLLVLPLEAESLYPAHTSLALGVFVSLVAAGMPFGPLAGRISDSLKHPLGRRRPVVDINMQAMTFVTAGMWLAAQAGWFRTFTVLFFKQQILWNAISATQTAILADLVEPSQAGTASGIQVASLLGGAVLGVLCFEGLALEGVDFRVNYAVMMGLGELMLPVFHLAATEVSSTRLVLPPAPELENPVPFVQSVYAIDLERFPDFGMVLRERSLYYAGVTTKVFLLYFIRDMIGVPTEQGQAALLADTTLAAESAAAITGMVTALLFNQYPLRPQDVSCFGAVVMAVATNFWACMYLDNVNHRKLIFLIQSTAYGVGQGSYLAGDLALAMKTVPNAAEASRYLALQGLSAFAGGAMGGMLSSAAMEGFGKAIPDALGMVTKKGAYNFMGYTMVLLFTSACNVGVCLLVQGIRTPEEMENPQDALADADEQNPQDGEA